MPRTYIVYFNYREAEDKKSVGASDSFEVQAEDERDAVSKADDYISQNSLKVENIKIADKQTGYQVFP